MISAVVFFIIAGLSTYLQLRLLSRVEAQEVELQRLSRRIEDIEDTLDDLDGTEG